MVIIKKDDYDFLFKPLDKEKQDALAPIAVIQEDKAMIDNEDLEVDLYDWINDLIVLKGLDEQYNPNSIGKRLEKLSDYVYSVIEA